MNMKKATLAFIIAGSLPCLLSGTENLVKNPDFEQVKNGKPVAWILKANGGSSGAITQDNSNRRAYIKKVCDGQSTAVTWSQDIRIKPETLYRLSGTVEGDGRLFWYELDKNWKYVRQVRGVKFNGKKGEKVSCEFRTADNAAICQIRFELYGKTAEGEGWLDNVSLEEVESPAAK